MDSKASPTEGTEHTIAAGSLLPEQGRKNHHHPPYPSSDKTLSTGYKGTLLKDIAVPPVQRSTDTHPPGVRSHTTRNKKGRRCTSPDDTQYHLLNELPATIEGFNQSTNGPSLAGRQHSHIVTDKALNILGATGVSERGPDSNDTQMEEYCDLLDGVSNLGEPHRYGIALSDPYLRVVPPPPISSQTTGLTQPDGPHIGS